MNITTTTTTEPSASSTLPQPDIYTAISLLSISTFTCLLLYYLIFDLSFFPPNPLKAPTTTTLLTTITTTTTTTLLSTTFTILLLFNLPPNNPAVRITSAILLVLTTTTSSISNTLLLYFSLPLITIYQKPYFHLKAQQRILLCGIIASILLFQLPHVIVAPGAATLYKNGHWSHAVTILERISVTAYCGREILLLGCYAWGVVRYLRPAIHDHYQQYHHQYQPHTGHGKGTQLLYTLLMAGCVSLILNIANIVAVYVVHTAAAMAFFPFVVSTKVLVEGVAVGRLVGFVDTSLQYYQQNSIYSVTGCGSQSRRGSAQPLIMQRGSVAMMSGGLGSGVGIGEGKVGGGGGEGEGSPGGTWGREKEQWWYRSRMGSVDTVVSVAEPPVAHSAEHLVQEVVVDLEGGAGVGVSRRTSVV
ncbi:hypothetical protein BO85DRAFT_450654 [Aspergillus piperis CBS 112811]|uniref:Uncharacterized protein n=1 Tax=Aspergillus piperis CBS 112811 TaxID=1448313 RepID=A0A8G1QYF3_9EURO|nr:hypothetical protein BO85DRAFT_450654 [Aspergillus piperis CBS 112811]RAH56004.1 hypothetical protein BO85DRAFT_450654 [Aspergillus piperis CBS 112811]